MNYQKLMEEQLSGLEKNGRTGANAPSLLLHSCCGPCSSAVIATLSSVFKITVFYYNPNIDEKTEYDKRAREQERLIGVMPAMHQVQFLEGEYHPRDFVNIAEIHKHEKEGGVRCSICYTLRIEKTAKTAHEGKWDFFTTTLSISPMKDAVLLNTIGSSLAQKYRVTWLWGDFKKKDGYKRSIEFSREYGLYRQDYCGCSYSRRDSDRPLL